MPPKYSTRRHKYKNKNAKTNKAYRKKREGGVTQRSKFIKRPDEINFNDKERIEFVTGFAKRKQERRIRAAKDLVKIEKQQHIEFRNKRREEEIGYLVQGGHMDDPLEEFLDNDSDIMSEIETEMDYDNNNNNNKQIEYENNDIVTTVITSIPTQMDRNIKFMDETRDDDENDNDIEKHDDDNDMEWIHKSDKNNGKLTVYEQRKEKKKRAEIRESKKKYNRKIKKMMKFVKEFNRNKKRKANAKYCKKGSKRKK
eukprot:538032_1